MNTQAEDIKFKLNKLKIALVTFGSFVFVSCGIGILYATGFKFSFDTLFANSIGIITITFFGMTGIFGVAKLFDNRPGLIINYEGIYDNSSAVGGQLIKWKDISEYDLSLVNGSSFIQIFVHNPKEYLSNANLFKRFWMRMNQKFYGTPISISPNFIKCDLVDLAKAIRSESIKHSGQQ